MRASTLALLLTASGCQCNVPVIEGPDGGADAGFVAQQCSVPTDCSGAPVVTSRCGSFGLDAGFSCVDHRCVAECSDVAGMTCDVGADHCLICPRGNSCIPIDCSDFEFDFHVEAIACVGPPPLEGGAIVHELPARVDAGECGARFALADGGTLGTLFLQSARMITVESPLLGGTCLAYESPTGAIRLMLDCPRCQVVLGP